VVRVSEPSLAATEYVSCREVSLVSLGRSAGIACVPITGGRRMIIWRVELTLDASIANRCSTAVSKS